jgi:FtsP/CotA-like multicopper oxidase with cupredoxin domain
MPRLRLLVAPLVALMLACPAAAGAATRTFWVGAVQTTWNVIPNERDGIMGEHFDPAQTVLPTVHYRRFTPGWKKVLPNPSGIAVDDRGIQGPLLRARVGDRIVVRFKNFDPMMPHSMHFHGVSYRPSSDGAYVPGFSGGDADVKPGRTWTYRLTAGPHSAGFWPYHDHGPMMDMSIAGGMYGGLSILGRHERAPDREFVVVFAQMDGFMSIDGRAFVGNTPVFHARLGDLVQWDVMAMGDDFHTFHVHGHRWMTADGPRDTRTVGPAESFRVRWTENAAGTWLYHCHVEGHMARGMIGLYRVRP